MLAFFTVEVKVPKTMHQQIGIVLGNGAPKRRRKGNMFSLVVWASRASVAALTKKKEKEI